MIEARLTQGGVLKKLSGALDEFLDFGTVSSFDCSADGIGLQAMDTAHVAVVSVMLRSQGFDYYRCNRLVSLGMNVDALATLLKCANDDDVVTMKAHASARHALPCIICDPVFTAVHLSVTKHIATGHPSVEAPSAAPGSCSSIGVCHKHHCARPHLPPAYRRMTRATRLHLRSRMLNRRASANLS